MQSFPYDTAGVRVVRSGLPVHAHKPKRKGGVMRKLTLALSLVALVALLVVPSALAVTVPNIPVATYGSALLAGLADAVTDVLPYAAAITAFAIGVGLIRRWLGAKKATRV